MKILVLCTGNSCRSQMAEGFLKSINQDLEVYSAGTRPADTVSRHAVKVMAELGIDISGQYPKNVNEFINENFDYVITVCDNAKESCPIFTGKVKQRLHIGFEDPYEATGTEDEILNVYRKIRDEIKEKFMDFYNKTVADFKNKSIAFIGAGRITKIILHAYKLSGYEFNSISVTDINNENLTQIKELFPDVNIYENNYENVLNSNYIFIALHPPAFNDFFINAEKLLNINSVLISLAPKITIAAMKEKLNGFDRIVRMNPNSPTIIGKGFCPTSFSKGLTDDLLNELNNLFKPFGNCPVVDEDKIEAFAVITAMGPTYFSFQFYELMRLAQSFGLSETDIEQGIYQMLNGTAELIFNSNLSKEEVLDLIPVKPLEKFETDIIEKFNSILPPLFSKLKS